MGVQRVPNEALRVLLAEARWTGDALSRAVNSVGAEAGLVLRYRRSSITHWLSGMRPRQPVPELVAEAFTRRLGRRVTSAETGLIGPRSIVVPGDSADSQWWRTDAVARLAELAGSGARREHLSGCVYSLAALAVPGWIQLLAAFEPGPSVPDPATRIGVATVEAAEVMLELFSDTDSSFGGGYVRRALAGYLAVTIGPWLRADASPAVRRRLLRVAARLTYLFGFLCFDDELHGSAERYYLTSLRLAAEAGDPACYAAGLRQLSVQARELGHLRPAVRLAEAAVRTATYAGNPATRAFLTGQLAVACAAAGDRRVALANLRAAEQHLDRAGSSAGSIAAYHPASLAHQRAAVLRCLGDQRGAVAALEHSIRHRPGCERRSRAITVARLAELRFSAGELDRACHEWNRFLDDYPQLHSGRADRALAILRADTAPLQQNPAVRALRHRAATLSVHRAEA